MPPQSAVGMLQSLANALYVLAALTIARVAGDSTATSAIACQTGRPRAFRVTVRCPPMQSGQRRKAHTITTTASPTRAIGTVTRAFTRRVPPALLASSPRTANSAMGPLSRMELPIPLQRRAWTQQHASTLGGSRDSAARGNVPMNSSLRIFRWAAQRAFHVLHWLANLAKSPYSRTHATSACRAEASFRMPSTTQNAHIHARQVSFDLIYLIKKSAASAPSRHARLASTQGGVLTAPTTHACHAQFAHLGME
jgi:hypothetical protein